MTLPAEDDDLCEWCGAQCACEHDDEHDEGDGTESLGLLDRREVPP